jgi:ATP synthase protein I
MKQAERDRPHQLAQTRFIVTLGALLVLPIIAGGYLGVWMDDLSEGYSVHWTVSLLLAGVIVGFANVYFYLKD